MKGSFNRQSPRKQDFQGWKRPSHWASWEKGSLTQTKRPEIGVGIGSGIGIAIGIDVKHSSPGMFPRKRPNHCNCLGQQKTDFLKIPAQKKHTSGPWPPYPLPCPARTRHRAPAPLREILRMGEARPKKTCSFRQSQPAFFRFRFRYRYRPRACFAIQSSEKVSESGGGDPAEIAEDAEVFGGGKRLTEPFSTTALVYRIYN